MNSRASEGTWSRAAAFALGSVPVASRWIKSDTERRAVRGIPGALSKIRGNDSICGVHDCEGNGGGGIEVGGEVDQPVLADSEEALLTPSGILFEAGPWDQIDS